MAEANEMDDAIVVSASQPEVPAVEPDKVDAPADEGTAPEQETKPEKTFTQKDLDELIQKRIAKEQRKYAKTIEQLESELEKTKHAPELPKPVRRDDFDDFEKYIEAKAEAKVQEELAKAAAKRQQEAAEYVQTTRQQEFTDSVEAMKAAGRSKYSDFDGVIEAAEVPLSSAMANAIIEADNGHDLAYHFAKHPEEAARIYSISSPTAAAIAIGKLSVKLEGEKGTKRVSSAPAPIKPVDSSSVAIDSSIPDAKKDSVEDWMRKREEHLSKQRRR